MHLVLAVVRIEALDGQKQLINGLSLRHMIADKEDAWHGFSSVDPGVCEAQHGLAIVRKQNSLLAGSPVKNDGIGRFRQTHILNAARRRLPVTAAGAAQYVAVKILVTCQFDHGAIPSPRRGP